MTNNLKNIFESKSKHLQGRVEKLEWKKFQEAIWS